MGLQFLERMLYVTLGWPSSRHRMQTRNVHISLQHPTVFPQEKYCKWWYRGRDGIGPEDGSITPERT